MDICGLKLTVKAPGTEKRTIFLPFHSSVEYLTARRRRKQSKISTDQGRSRRLGGTRLGDYVRIPQAVRLSVSGVYGTYEKVPEGMTSPTLTVAIVKEYVWWW